MDILKRNVFYKLVLDSVFILVYKGWVWYICNRFFNFEKLKEGCMVGVIFILYYYVIK